jgi:hypothetical protein
MNPLALDYVAQTQDASATSRNFYEHNPDSSTSTESTENTVAEECSTRSRQSSFDSGTSTFYIRIEQDDPYIPQKRQTATPGMTTFYHYDKDGRAAPSHLDPAAQVFTRGLPESYPYAQEGDAVGAYLAHRQIKYPAPASSHAHQFQGPTYQPYAQPFIGNTNPTLADQGYWSNDDYDSSGYTDSSQSCPSAYNCTVGYAGWTSRAGVIYPYPDPESIRHLHTLQSLLPNIQPERKINSLQGPVVDIVEQDSGVIFAYQVPKKLLVLFLGRRTVNKFIRTVHREDDVNWKGAPTCQELNLPRVHCSKASIRILVSWMLRACNYETMGAMKQIRIPKNTFIACSLAETMQLLDLHKDALRVDKCIALTHFIRPIFAVELEALWNCLGEKSRYVYAAIRTVGRRLHAHENGYEGQVPGIDDEMYAMLEDYPRLEARVRDLELNQEYLPQFGTEWFQPKRQQSRTRGHKEMRSRASEEGYRNEATSNFRDYWPAQRLDPTPQPQPQPVDTEKTVRKFAVLRIVNENSKPTVAKAEASTEAEQKTGKQESEW